MPPIPESLEELRTAILRGDVTPRAAAEAALARANSNASHNVYIALDAERVLREADALPQRFQAAAIRPAGIAEGLLRSRRLPYQRGHPILRGS
jgi:Asp-tRNA(Asn)/Glu-tRNA(Gln) amidotransferase A subunit family amidase